jgi:hypothetical protein
MAINVSYLTQRGRWAEKSTKCDDATSRWGPPGFLGRFLGPQKQGRSDAAEAPAPASGVAGYARKKATQKAVRAKKLDSLLIDEGFGTLDPKALDAAARRY